MLDITEVIIYQMGTVPVIVKKLLVWVGDANELINRQTQYDTCQGRKPWKCSGSILFEEQRSAMETKAWRWH